MVNTDDFIKRLELIFDYYSISSSSFADKIGVQRSSLSHLLSGRNKPSLDLILKIISVYPEVDLYWILNGKGNFPKNSDVKNKVEKNSDETTTLFSLASKNNEEITEEKKSDEERKIITSEINNLNSEKITEKIVFFYTDGSFKEYKFKN